jgi:ABC-type multidrug transport system permease subunit
MRLLRRMADEGRTIILTTHATRNLAVCDRVVVVNDGRVVYTGPPDEALEHFGVEDFVEVYASLAAEPAEAQVSRYLNSGAYAAYAGGRLIGPDPAAERAQPPDRVSRGQALRTVRHQVAVLTRRNIRLMLADRPTLAIRLLTAPVIGAGLLLLFGSEIFALHRGIGASVVNASALLYVVVVVLIFTTSATAAREISGERSIYLRERLVNLSPLAYVLAKLNVLLALALVQTALLLAVVIADTNLLTSDRATLFNLYAAMLMVSFTGVTLGLLVSSFSGTSDQANLSAVVLMIPQLIFAGLIVPLSRMPDAARAVADIIPAKWSLELLGGLTDLAPRIDIEREGGGAAFVRPVTSVVADNFVGAFDQVLVWRWLCLAAFCAVFVALTILNQSAKGSVEPRRLPFRPRLPRRAGAAALGWTRAGIGR